VTRRISERSCFLRLVGSDVHEERLAPLTGDPLLLEIAAHDQHHADEHMKQNGDDDRDDKKPVGLVLGQPLRTPFPHAPHTRQL